MSTRWYHTELAKQLKTRKLYVGLNASLILAVPLVLYWLPLIPAVAVGETKLPFMTGSQVAIVIAQLTAVLTGVLGLNRVFLGWHKANSRFVQLWKAAANLKTEYFTLYTKYRGTLHDKKLQERHELENDMKAATTKARQIALDEQDEFFRSLSSATPVDALDVLQAVPPTIGTLVAGLRSAEVTKSLQGVEQAHQQRKAVTKLEAEQKAIEGLINQRLQRLAELPSPSPEEQSDIKNALKTWRAKRDDKESELVVAKAALAALTS